AGLGAAGFGAAACGLGALTGAALGSGAGSGTVTILGGEATGVAASSASAAPQESARAATLSKCLDIFMRRRPFP
ncbi:MAG: hypothetical protein KGM15_15935, partial [Pseudomonadota bacterium]|nr:hypothetical protein [Pseudomonadota bacterium]